MKILLTNDDGIDSPVLLVLARALSASHEVTIVAPATDQSGMAQAFTHRTGLTYRELPPARLVPSPMPFRAFMVDGTPCDCVKFVISHLLRHDPPELVISGINLGENAGMSCIYSGTVAAAREAAMWGLPALAVSVWRNDPGQLNGAVEWLVALLRHPDLLKMPPGLFWNVNFPDCPPEEVRGFRFTTMSTVMFTDAYEEAVRPDGGREYLIAGRKPKHLFRPGTDDAALDEKFAAITPLQLSQSHAGEAERLGALAARMSDGPSPFKER